MNRILYSAHHRIALDRQRCELSEGHQWLCNKPVGAIKQVRSALGMTLIELAARMGKHHSRIGQLGGAERTGNIQMRLLKQAANAMDCDLVYTFVPRPGSFQRIIEQRVKQKAKALELSEDEAIRHSYFWRD